MARPTTNPSDQATTVRNLKLLVVLLILSNVALGVFSVYLLRTVDRRYSQLIDSSVPLLNDLQQLMTDTVGAQRATGSGLFAAPEATRADALPNARAADARERKFAGDFFVGPRLEAFPALRASLQKASEDHRAAVAELIGLYAAGKIDEGNRLREQTVRPVFDRYVALIDRVSDAVLAQSQRVSTDYTAKTNSLSTVVLGVAGWPLLVLAALLLLTVFFVVAMMVAFRGKDMADMP
jgi:hypothetical protein